MKLSPITPAAGAMSVNSEGLGEVAGAPSTSAPAVLPDVHVGAQAASVQRAQMQLAQMPEVDAARVTEIKEALARGDIGFDPQKLAQLIVRHHGGGA